jgi:hypothetical protein
MPRAKQLTVSVADRPGILGEIATALGEKKVNIVGISGGKMGDRGVIWMVVDKHAAAKKAIAAKGWEATEDEVLSVALGNSPGTLGRFASKLGKAGINIMFMYVGAGTARKVNAYFGVSDLKAALKIRP